MVAITEDFFSECKDPPICGKRETDSQKIQMPEVPLRGSK
jgi:hypothetical protein